MVAGKGVRAGYRPTCGFDGYVSHVAVNPAMVRLALMKKSLKPGKKDGVYGGDSRPSTAALGAVGTSFQVDAAIARLRRDNK